MSDQLIQGSEEWRQARCGSLGASRVADAIARTKTGYGASRANLMAELLIERLTGVPAEGFMSDAMRWGVEKEPEARIAYEFRTGADVAQVGLIKHPTIVGTHASPDGLVGDDGLIEIKCPQSAAHLEFLLTGSIPQKYLTQMQWQMACTERLWCDFCSYDPRMPESMRLFIKQVAYDPKLHIELSNEVTSFLGELERKLDDLRSLYEREPFADLADKLKASAA